MRGAIYFPHTHIQSERLFKTSLLLWDRVHVIVPFKEFRARYDDPIQQRAHELLCVNHYPSERAKSRVHEFVEDFASRPQLPQAFLYRLPDGQYTPNVYEVYPQKLLERTWRLLYDSALAGGVLPNADMPVSEPMGLTLMSLLADSCAGKTLARITDRAEAYSGISSLLAESPLAGEAEAPAVGALAARSLRVLDTDQLSLKRLVEYREREESSVAGHELRELRHRYLNHLTQQAQALATTEGENDQRELQRQFEDDSRDDLRGLKRELAQTALEVVGHKELVAAVLISVAALGVPALGVALPSVVGYSGAALSVGGLMGLRSKFARSRLEVLRKHPMAYVYEATGGLRW